MSRTLPPTFRARLRQLLRVRRRRHPAPLRSSPAPGRDVETAWDEAFARVESYLRAHHLSRRVLLNQLTTEIIDAARTLAAEQPEAEPLTLAMRVAHARIGDWLVQVMREGDWADERFRARGRLALLLTAAAERCPDGFLTDHPLPDDLAARLRTARLRAGPEMQLTSMPAAPLDLPATAPEPPGLHAGRMVLVRASASWLSIVGFLGLLWATSR